MAQIFSNTIINRTARESFFDKAVNPIAATTCIDFPIATPGTMPKVSASVLTTWFFSNSMPSRHMKFRVVAKSNKAVSNNNPHKNQWVRNEYRILSSSATSLSRIFTNGLFSIHSLERPYQNDHRYRYSNHNDLQWQSHSPVISKAITAGPHNQGIVFMANRRQKCAGSGYCYSHEKRIRANVQTGGDINCNRRRNNCSRCIV